MYVGSRRRVRLRGRSSSRGRCRGNMMMMMMMIRSWRLNSRIRVRLRCRSSSRGRCWGNMRMMRMMMTRSSRWNIRSSGRGSSTMTWNMVGQVVNGRNRTGWGSRRHTAMHRGGMKDRRNGRNCKSRPSRGSGRDGDTRNRMMTRWNLVGQVWSGSGIGRLESWWIGRRNGSCWRKRERTYGRDGNTRMMTRWNMAGRVGSGSNRSCRRNRGRTDGRGGMESW